MQPKSLLWKKKNASLEIKFDFLWLRNTHFLLKTLHYTHCSHYLGRHLTAQEFGYSVEHIRAILNSSPTGRLSIQGGDIVMYRVPGPKEEMKVFIRSKLSKRLKNTFPYFYKPSVGDYM